MGLSDAGKTITISTKPKTTRSYTTSGGNTYNIKTKSSGKQLMISDAEIQRQTGAAAIDARTGGVFQTKTGLEARGLYTGESLQNIRYNENLIETQAKLTGDLSKFTTTTKRLGGDVTQKGNEITYTPPPSYADFVSDINNPQSKERDAAYFMEQERLKKINEQPRFVPGTTAQRIEVTDYVFGVLPRKRTQVNINSPEQTTTLGAAQLDRGVSVSSASDVINNKGVYIKDFTPKSFTILDKIEKTNPLSAEGFKVRMGNVGLTITSFGTGKNKITNMYDARNTLKETVPGQRVLQGIEFAADKPFLTAAIIGGGRHIGMGYKSFSGLAGAANVATRTVYGGTVGLISTTGLGYGAKIGGFDFGALNQKEREAIRFSPELYKQSTNTALEYAEKNTGTLGSIAGEISPTFYNTQSYRYKLNEQLQKSNKISQTNYENLYSAGVKTKIIKGIAEPVALVTSSMQVELAGRSILAKEFSKTKGVIPQGMAYDKLFKIGFTKLKGLGFIEGTVQQSMQDINRGSQSSFNKYLGVGGFGAVSAGFIGGKILALSSTSKRAALGVEFVASALDVTEKPGDLLADLSTAYSKNVFKSRVVTPALNFGEGGIKLTTDISGGRSVPKTKTKTTKSFNDLTTFTPSELKTFGYTETDFLNPGQTFKTSIANFVSVPSSITTSTSSSIPNNVGTDLFSNVPATIPTDINTNINIDIPSELPATIPTDINTNIQIPTTVNTNVNTNIPVNAFSFQGGGFPLLLPPQTGGGGGSRGKRKKRGKKRSLLYSPSLTAITYNIRGKKSNYITGFGIRPII